jgi:hypothetical protein
VKWIRVPALLLALLAPAWPALGKGDAPGAPEAALREAEQRRTRAMVDAELAVLGPLLGEELRFVHANGSVQDRAELLDALGSGRLDYLSARTHDTRVRSYGDVGVVGGGADLRVRAAGGPPLALRILFTAVYAKRGGAWQLVAYQSTRAREEEPR